MRSWLTNIYHYLESIPDRLYPFASEIEGKWVRGLASYKAHLNRAFTLYGPGRIGYKLNFYRGAWHFIGSVLLIVLTTILSQRLFGSETALYVILGMAIVLLFIQEFFSHPIRFQQPRGKSITDWLTWVIPILIYLFLLH